MYILLAVIARERLIIRITQLFVLILTLLLRIELKHLKCRSVESSYEYAAFVRASVSETHNLHNATQKMIYLSYKFRFLMRWQPASLGTINVNRYENSISS